MSNPIKRFNELADVYDEFTETMPNHDEMNSVLLEFLEHYHGVQPFDRIADLGCGTGTLARTLIEQYKPTTFLALDGASQMLKKARKTLKDCDVPTDIKFQQESFTDWSPTHRYDLVYSSIAIHHLADEEKWKLFHRIYGGLETGGLFLYADIFTADPGWTEIFKTIHWERRRKLGMSEDEIEQRWQSHKDNDRPAQLDQTLKALEQAGFQEIELLWKNLNRAIIIAK